LKLVFKTSDHHLNSLIEENEIPATSLKVLGKPLIIRNIDMIREILDIDTVLIPDEYSGISQLIQDNFPSINVKGFHRGNKEENNDDENGNKDKLSETTTIATNNIIIRRREGIAGTKNDGNDDDIEIPINSLICHYFGNSNSIGNNDINGDSDSGNIYKSNNDLIVYPIVYPWDFLNVVEKVLKEEVMQTSISPNASIAKSAIIKGPCIIEDNVTIDDFCKIIGPTYISNGSFIGTGSLVRECMIGSNTKIGYNCEIGRTYLAGDDEIAHVNIILDSIIGKTVWFGGYSITSNTSLTKQSIRCEIGDGKSIDIGTHRFGSIVGNNCTIGTSVTLLPARHVPANTVIPDETTYGKNIVIT
jgi:UDP-N-acetylglucosamine diphosphorylase / glucose-1-phosphate thymidylyltransferase / UDP-N-acetylgalactosamine diphosphorylase / glucosamine-1-phosphate N-acetyltransferase / galactosamine-1-phosphate N-acetyltransferase